MALGRRQTLGSLLAATALAPAMTRAQAAPKPDDATPRSAISVTESSSSGESEEEVASPWKAFLTSLAATASNPSKPVLRPVSSGMPSSRSSALSRSNMRKNASSPPPSGYPATSVRIFSAVRYWRVLSRHSTRFTSLSARTTDTFRTLARLG